MPTSIRLDELDGYRNGRCAFSNNTLGLRVAANQSTAPFNKPELRSGPSTFPLRGRFAHELDHLFRCLSTSWGLACHVLLCRLLGYYTRMLGEFDLEQELGGASLAKVVQDIRLRGANSEFFSPQNSLCVGLHTFVGENEMRRALMGYVPTGPLTAVGNALNRRWKVDDVPTDIETFFCRPPNELAADHAVTAESIVESLGILKEAIFAVDAAEAVQAEVLTGAGLPYTFSMSLAKDLLTELFDWEFQPVELEAALNLALWPPIQPTGLTSGSEFRWHDLEPGYRYCRILNWLRRRGSRLTAHDDLTHQARDDMFNQFFAEACRHFRWPQPRELAAMWRTHLAAAAPWSKSEFGWWCLGQQRLRTKGSLHLLTEFEHAPYMAWFTSSHGDADARPSFNFIHYDDKIEIHEQYCDDDGTTISARLESYIYSGMFLASGFRASVRDEDREILRQHFRIMPQFAATGPARDLVVRNCAFLAAHLGI